MIYVFASVGLMFLARTLGLMVLMVFAPFAFISIAIPGGKKAMEDWGWDSWFDNLIKLSLLAPIFIFFLFKNKDKDEAIQQSRFNPELLDIIRKTAKPTKFRIGSSNTCSISR